MQIVDRGAVLLRDARSIHAGGLRKQRVELRNCRFSGRSLLSDELPRGNDPLLSALGYVPAFSTADAALLENVVAPEISKSMSVITDQ